LCESNEAENGEPQLHNKRGKKFIFWGFSEMKKFLSFILPVALVFAFTVSAIAESNENELDNQSSVFEIVIYQDSSSEPETLEQEYSDVDSVVHDDEVNESELTAHDDEKISEDTIEETGQDISSDDVTCNNDEADDDEIEQDECAESPLASDDNGSRYSHSQCA
jgi:hypothetical protein